VNRMLTAGRTTLALAAALALAALAREAGAECWRIPAECYSVDLEAAGLKVSLRGRAHGHRFASVTAGKQAERPLACLESVRGQGTTCAHYYVCKPLDTRRPDQLDTDTTEQLEVRWSLTGVVALEAAEVRHSLTGVKSGAGRWLKVKASVSRWTTVSSGAPTCSAKTRQR